MSDRLTTEIRKRGIPPLYTQGNAADPIMYLEIQLFQFDWYWYVCEYQIETDGRDILFFGFVRGFENEWGYFRLSELEMTGSPVMVNYKFKPLPFSELKQRNNL
jgi:hypothetical protein